MRRPKLTNTMIGNVYPFFLNNQALKTYYLYQIVSPGALSDYTPLLTFQKICERTGDKDFSAVERKDYCMYGADIIATLLKSRKNIKAEAVKYLSEQILARGDGSWQPTLYENDVNFPVFEMDWNNSVAKALIIGLRDALRWQQYRFAPGNKIDLLLTPTKFGVFEIKGDKEAIWLEPVGVFHNSDVEMKNPIAGVNMQELDWPKGKYVGATRASALNRVLRQTEWKSFDNAEIKEAR